MRDEEIIQVEDMHYTVEPLYNEHSLGNKVFGLTQRWALLRGCFVHKLLIWDLASIYIMYHSWPFFRLRVGIEREVTCMYRAI